MTTPRVSRAPASFRMGGVAALASGALFLAKAILDLVVGEPPADGARLLAWVRAHELPLALTNEILVISAVLLIPVVLALHRDLDGPGRPWTSFGCGLLATAVPVIIVLGVVHGRLVYPVFGISLDDPATAALVVSTYYGGAHAVSLMLAVALVVLGLAMRGRSFAPAATPVALVAGAAQVAGSYPWLIGPVLTSLTQATFAAWLVVVGVGLTRSRPVDPHTPRGAAR